MRSLLDRLDSWLEIYSLNREARKTTRRWRRAGKGHELDMDYSRAIRDIENQIAMRLSNDLLNEAQALRLPIPRYRPGCEEWYADEEGKLTLRTVAFKALRDEVRLERKMRFEAFARWVTLIGTLVTMLVGLTGALIGLVTVLRRR